MNKFLLAIRNKEGNVVGYFQAYDMVPTLSLSEAKEYNSYNSAKETEAAILLDDQYLLDGETIDVLSI